MHRVIWSDRAFKDLNDIDSFLSEKSRQASQKIILNLLERAKQLEQFPFSGTREMFFPEHRYLVEGNYKIVFRVEDNSVFITRIFDMRQNPGKLKD